MTIATIILIVYAVGVAIFTGMFVEKVNTAKDETAQAFLFVLLLLWSICGLPLTDIAYQHFHELKAKERAVEMERAYYQHDPKSKEGIYTFSDNLTQYIVTGIKPQ